MMRGMGRLARLYYPKYSNKNHYAPMHHLKTSKERVRSAVQLAPSLQSPNFILNPLEVVKFLKLFKLPLRL